MNRSLLLVALALFAASADAATNCARTNTPLGRLAFTISPGSTQCGGPGLSPRPEPPFAGELDDASGAKITDLGLGCLYFGGGGARFYPPAMLPDGSTSLLDIAGVQLAGTALRLVGSAGTGPADCTRGAGPGTHCLDASPGTDGAGACTTDADCSGAIGSCGVDAHCYFGTPTPVGVAVFPSLSVCIVNAIARDACGSANLLTRETTLSAGLSARVYLSTGGATQPCPQCVAGTCSAGRRAGLTCSGGVGSKQTTIECPPLDELFVGSLAVDLSPLTTGTSVAAADASGTFCPAQRTPGAFGVAQGARVRTTGAPLVSQIPNIFATTLAGTFCVPATGNFSIDLVADLPGPGAVSIPGVAAINLPGLPLGLR